MKNESGDSKHCLRFCLPETKLLPPPSINITEISDSGSVPELQFTNESETPVFLLDGEELLGAKQNRVLNLSILAPAKKPLKVPVSCVEAGRWHHSSAEFDASPRAQYAEGRARKMENVSFAMAMSAGSAHHSNQSEVWSGIALKSARMNVESETAAMSEIFEQHEKPVENYVAAFTPQENQVGGIFAINGQIVGMELFDSPETFRKLLPKLLRSYAIDAVEKRYEQDADASQESAEGIIQAVKGAEQQRFAAVGLGEDVRLNGAGILGAALEYENRLVHLSVFRTQGEAREAASPTMNRPLRATPV